MLALVCPAPGQTPSPSSALVPEEELVYNVRYGFIDLGQVRIRTYGRDTVNGVPALHAKAFIDSYAGVPFVDLHATFESWIDPGMFSRKFIGKSKEGKQWDYARYHFSYDEQRVLIESGRRDTVVEKRDTLTLSGHTQDGLSLFFFARDQLRSRKKQNVPCVVTEKNVNTFIDFSDERSSVEVDAVEYPVDVIGFEGTAEFVGIFGLTGDFEGWFSNDAARVPVLAKMKVIIGSITIELMEWKRAGWTPPRGE